jgi:hypothetical protein
MEPGDMESEFILRRSSRLTALVQASDKSAKGSTPPAAYGSI